MKDFKKQFGQRVRFYRKLLEYTQEMLAEKSELSVTAISNVETGYHYPSYPALRKIVNALNITPLKLFLFDDETWTIDDEALAYYISEYFIGLTKEQRMAVINIAKAMQEQNRKKS